MNEGLRCSFCDKTKEQARILIAGASSVFICDVCVDLCARIVAGGTLRIGDQVVAL